MKTVNFDECFTTDDDFDLLNIGVQDDGEKRPSIFVDIAKQSKFKVVINDDARTEKYIEPWCWKDWCF